MEPLPQVVEPARFLERPMGEGAWFLVAGRSMGPLLRTGDAVHVLRCDLGGIERGDIALVQDAAGRFLVHLVVKSAPLSTASIHGVPDPQPLMLIGRVNRVRRGDASWPLPPLSRSLVWAAYRAGAWIMGTRAIMVLGRGIDSKWARRALAHGRTRRAGPIVVRRLSFQDVEALVSFAAENLAIPADFLKRQLLHRWHRAGVAGGAFDRAQRMVGFAFVDEFREEGMDVDGWWLRSVFVQRRARGLGVGRRLVELLCREAAEQGVSLVRADVPAGNSASRGLFSSAGFGLSDSRWVDQIDAEWRRHGIAESWVVFEKDLGRAR